MKKALALAALAVAFPVGAQQPLSGLTNPELCVMLATTVLTGGHAQGVPQTDIMVELRSRQEQCQPTEIYWEAAQHRQQQSMAADYEQRARSAERRNALIGILQQYSNTPQAAPPQPIQRAQQNTNCRWVGQNWICESW